MQFSSPKICLALITSAPSPKKWTPASAYWEETWGPVQKNADKQPYKLYLALVRSVLEYNAVVWDPHQQRDINKLEYVQCHTTRFVKQDCRPFSITKDFFFLRCHPYRTDGERSACLPLQNCRWSHPNHSSRILSDTCAEQGADQDHCHWSPDLTSPPATSSGGSPETTIAFL